MHRQKHPSRVWDSTHHIQHVGIAGPYSLFGHIQKPRSKFSLRSLTLSFEPQRHQTKEGQQQLYENGKEIFGIVNFAYFRHFGCNILIVVVVSVYVLVILNVIVCHGAIGLIL